MKNTTLAIKLEGPKERDEFVEAITMYIMANVDRSLAIKRRICLLSGFPEITNEDEEQEEKQTLLLACEKIASFFLGEIDEEKLSEEFTNILYNQLIKKVEQADEDEERSVMIFCKKALPLLKWEMFPGASTEIAAQHINTAIRLADSKGITLRELFKNKDYYKEMIISLYKDSESFASETARQITEFFTLELAETVYIDSMVESGDISVQSAARQKMEAEKSEQNKQDGKRIALAGKIIAIESAMTIFGKTDKSEHELHSLIEELHELNKIVVPA